MSEPLASPGPAPLCPSSPQCSCALVHIHPYNLPLEGARGSGVGEGGFPPLHYRGEGRLPEDSESLEGLPLVRRGNWREAGTRLRMQPPGLKGQVPHGWSLSGTRRTEQEMFLLANCLIPFQP